MGGGLMQLVAYGAQDIYLTGNPQITFFKVVYKRHTNFASEAIEQTFNGNINFGQMLSCKITKNGDLVTKIYLKIKLKGSSVANGKWAWVDMLGYAIIDFVELQIGGTAIDKQYGEWLSIWYELTHPSSHDRGINKMIGNTESMTQLSSASKDVTLFVPLQFFCCRHNGLAIPLIALQYHEIRFDIKLRKSNELIIRQGDSSISSYSVSPTIELDDITLLTNYIYLDSDERKRFSQASHEYLIEQIQTNGEEIIDLTNKNFKLNFNHPCKCLYWAMKHGDFITGNTFLSYYVNDDATDENIRIGSIRYVLANSTSIAGVITIGVDLLLTYGGVTIKAIKEKVNISNEVDALVNNFTVETEMDIKEISKPVSKLTFGTRTTDTLNEGHPNYDYNIYMWNNFSLNIDKTINPIINAQLQLNGHDRFSTQNGDYFNYVQPYENHINTPVDGINVYSFAINPVEHQPSGTCNFSRIDNTTLNIQFDSTITQETASKINIYTVNYNILRIMSGMGGLAYAN